MWPNPQVVTFTEEILNRKLYFLCSAIFFFWFAKVILISENINIYGKTDTEKVDLGRLYYLYKIAFFLLPFFFTWSKWSVELLN